MMAFALLESLAVTGLLLMLSAILPPAWLKDGFAFKGFIAIIIATATAVIFQKVLQDDFPAVWLLLAMVAIPVALISSIIVFLRSRPKLRDLLLNIEDRVLIMLFIYVPIGLLSLIIVLYRNLL